MSERNTTLLMEDICNSIEKIFLYTEGMDYESFIADDKTVDAVSRNFEIIGEAANRLPDEYKVKFPNVDWFRIIGFRNRIIHAYFGIDFNILWKIIEDYLPTLQNELKVND